MGVPLQPVPEYARMVDKHLHDVHNRWVSYIPGRKIYTLLRTAA